MPRIFAARDRFPYVGGVLLVTTALTAATCSPMTPPTSPSGAGTMAEAATPTPAPAPPTPVPAPATARYRATFDSNWTAATHPVDVPASPHFSAMIGGTHNASVTFWRVGALASDGIKDMAELGATEPLFQEISAAIAAGTAERVFRAGGSLGSPGTDSLEFDVSQAFPLVTLVSMIAPSPDWFVGVSGLVLFENGNWVDERRVALVPWDAGTDSGVTFTSADVVTVPRQPITAIVTAPLSPGGLVTPLGTFTFTRIRN